MNSLFLDTSALIALLNKRDQNHSKIVDFLQKKEPFRGVLSNLILAELLSFFSRHGSLSDAIKFQEAISKDRNFRIVWVDEALHRQASQILAKYADHKISFTDASSFGIMKKEKITQVLSFDDDFARAGFEIFPLDQR